MEDLLGTIGELAEIARIKSRAQHPAEDQIMQGRATKGTFKVYQVYTAQELEAAGINAGGEDQEELRATFYYDTDAQFYAASCRRATGREFVIRED